jgi:DNA polymerase III subunit delta'
MSFANLAEQQDAVLILQRSLERGRLGHAYLFQGCEIEELERVARTLAKTLSCEKPVRASTGAAIDCCDECPTCCKMDGENHPDVQWIRPESKTRVIRIEQIRGLLQTVYLKPTIAPFKVGVIVEADRLNAQAANAFLKTLEEPPGDSILILLTVEPQRILETILSRCLRLNLSGEAPRHMAPDYVQWLRGFSEAVAQSQTSLLGRYKVLSVILARLGAIKESITEVLTKRSPLEVHDDIEAKLKERWEDELSAAIEAEYRRQRSELLAGLQWWMRDVWLLSQNLGDELLTYPSLANPAAAVASRVNCQQAGENLEILEKLQRQLTSNVQEALALEVGLLRLKL